jgi:hypothetical protein
MFALLKQLSSVFYYLKIKGEDKFWLDWFSPIVITALCLVLYWLLPVNVRFYSVSASGEVVDGGMMVSLRCILGLLPGFYLTSLAAISTFNKDDLDKKLPSPTPTVEIKIKGKPETIDLTRRRFLSYMFGYLTFLSFTLFLFTFLGEVFCPSYTELVDNLSIWKYARWGGIFIFFTLFWQMFIITVFGIYQLSDRIHRVDYE